MRIALTRTGRHLDRLVFTRDDGTGGRVPVPSSPGVPHDLAHYVVETSMGMKEGFWGLVAHGVDFVTADAVDRLRSEGGAPSIEYDTTEILQAEALVEAFHASLADGIEHDDNYLWYLVAKACRVRNVPVPESASTQRVQATLAALRRASDAWSGLAPGESLDLQFPVPAVPF